ncbi:hypothetical protein Pcinc_018121 [Petrolisthes cinctipes]|uniref:Uncharacterized protein n=1 Tax=Petrolisthes cinctipes TaxID=88211 RepID=A0AAE1FMS3_PETCI|nr:hypothetical protein Pcinc_018121 [Petrolisthes cinctipes]
MVVDSTLLAVRMSDERDQTSSTSTNADTHTNTGELCTSESSNASSKNISNKTEGSNCSSTSNVSAKLTSKQPGTKVIASRFKAAAAAVKEHSSGYGSGSGSGSGRSRLDVTLSSGGGAVPRKKLVSRNTGVGKSYKADTGGLAERPAAVAGHPSGTVAKKYSQVKKPARVPGHGSTGKLHSTVLNATITDIPAPKSVSNVFSTTMVGGFAPGNRKVDMNMTGVTLPDLPDVSCFEVESKIANSTILSQGESEKSVETEITAEDLEKEHLSYLQWHYLSVNSEAAFASQGTQAQDIISFIEHLTEEKERELSELRRARRVLRHHQQVSDAYHTSMEQVQTLTDGVPASEDAMGNMSRELEKSLNQVKMENLYIPQNHKEYRDDLSKVLIKQQLLLRDLGNLMKPRLQHLNSTKELLCNLQSTTEKVHQCENEVQQAVGLAVQEASLQIGAKQMRDSTSDIQPKTSVDSE